MKRKLRACAVPAMLVAVLALAGCSAGVTAATTAAAEAAASGKLSVVATTNVWGDIAESVGGDHVAVTALIDDPSIDPHEFQADARDQLAIAKANVVIENGGGYDDFAGTMLATVKNPKRVTLNAVDLSRTTQSLDGSINEHVWYDFPTVTRVVEALRGTLATLDPAHAAAYQANASALTTKLGALEASTADLKAKYAGKGAAITEPVPLYLLNAIGLVDKTPTKFSEAIENGSDVAPSVLRETLA
ncbi:MAG: zinc ABC transporter substrate-binding protein, partial [Microbacteriaceae bacterium]